MPNGHESEVIDRAYEACNLAEKERDRLKEENRQLKAAIWSFLNVCAGPLATLRRNLERLSK